MLWGSMCSVGTAVCAGDSALRLLALSLSDRDLPSPLGMPTLPIVASTTSSVALILLLVVLFVLLQPKLKSFQTSR